jgi:hypothetical protein
MVDAVEGFVPMMCRSQTVCPPLPEYKVNGEEKASLLELQSPPWEVIIDKMQPRGMTQRVCFNDASVVRAREHPHLIG